MGMYSAGNSAAMFQDVAIEEAIANSIGEMQSVTPARIISYYRNSHYALVEPLVMKTSATEYKRMPLYVCTVRRLFAGRFLIDIPLNIGDTGWLIASDADTDFVKQRCLNNNGDADVEVNAQQLPNTERTHRYEFGFFIPDRWGDKYMVDENHVTHFDDEDNDRLVIQTEDGKQRVSFKNVDNSGRGEIKITSIDKEDDSKKTIIVIRDGEVMVETTTKTSVKCPDISVVSKNVDVTASESAKVHSPLISIDSGTSFSIDGTLTVTGDITSTGGEITDKRGVVLGTHTHKYNPGPGAPAETVTPTT